MREETVSNLLKLQVFAAVIFLLFQVNLNAAGQQQSLTTMSQGTTNLTDSQDVSSGTQPADPTHPSLLNGIVLTAIIVVSILGGLTCMIICAVVTVVVSVKINKRRKQNKRRRRESSTINATAVNVRSFDMTSNTAYRCGGQVTGGNINVYSPRPNSRASNTQNADHSTAEFVAPVLPSRYVHMPNNRMDISVDSLGYVKLPKPHN